MEAHEVQELKENAEHGSSESSLRPVAFTMSVLAVLVAVITVLGHRTHTEAVLDQNKATDQWNQYQAQKIRAYNTSLAADVLSGITIADKDIATANKDKSPEAAKAYAENQAKWNEKLKAYADHQAKWNEDLPEDQEKARKLEEKVEHAEARADRFDFSEALLEIGLVITSITLLTRSRWYWYLGIIFSVIGIASALSVLLLK